MIAKRPTKKLHKLGVEANIIIQKGLYGFYLYDTNLNHQRSTARETSDEAIADAISGLRPIKLEE